MKRVTCVLLSVLVACTLSADKVVLHSGGKVEGSVTFDGKQAIIKQQNGKEVKVAVTDIKEVVLEGRKEEVGAQKKVLAEDVRRLLDAARKARKKYPDCEFVLLLDWGRYEVREDGSRVYTYHGAWLLNRPKALRLASRALWFEPGRSEVKVLLARTILPDGTVVEVPKKAFRVTEPSYGADFYDYGKILTFSFPAAKVGSIIELRYRSVNFRPYDKKIFYEAWFFGGKEPVLFSHYEVVVPAKQKIYWYTEGGKVSEQVLPGRDKFKVVWEYRDWPGVREEVRMPPVGELVPRVFVSPFKPGDWAYINNWYARRLKANMKVTDFVRKTAERIVGDAKTAEEKVARIYHWVQRNVEYLSSKVSVMSGLCGHPADVTLRRRRGDCIDKAVLTATLLNAVGVEAYPVGVLTNNSGFPDVKLPNFIGNHAILEVRLSGKKLILDPTSTDYRFPARWSASHGTYIHNPITGELYLADLPKPEQNAYIQNIVVVLRPNQSAFLERSITPTGDDESDWRWWIRTRKKEELQQWLESLANAYSPASKIVAFETSDLNNLAEPLKVTIKVDVSSYGTRAGDFLILRLPNLYYRFPETVTKKRKYDIWYNTTYCAQHTITIHLPKHYEVYHLPPPISIKTPFVEYEASYTAGKNRVVFNDNFRRLVRIVPAKDYSVYRKALQKIAAYAQLRVFLRRKK